MAGVELFFNLLTRNALVIYRGVAHVLDGPYSSRADAELAAGELVKRIEADARSGMMRYESIADPVTMSA